MKKKKTPSVASLLVEIKSLTRSVAAQKGQATKARTESEKLRKRLRVNAKRKVTVSDRPLALLSVFDKTGIVEFALALIAAGYDIVSTGGTYKALRKAGVPCLKVEQVTGVKEFLDGRVKTINHMISAGILAKRETKHLAQLKRRGLRPVGVVCVNLYPFQATVAVGAEHDEIIEKIDIGGVLALRAAAKNYGQGVLVVGDPSSYGRVMDALKQGEISEGLRLDLAISAFRQTAIYDTSIWQYFIAKAGKPARAMLLEPVHELRKAENDCQGTSMLCRDLMAGDDPLAWHMWDFVSGNPGHVNLCGADSALRVMCRLAEAFRVYDCHHRKVPFIAIACKHGNPCGLGVSWSSPLEAIDRCMSGDADAVMGAEIMVNFHVDGEAAIRIHCVMEAMRPEVGRNLYGSDVVCAAGFSEGARTLLSGGRHLLANPHMTNPVMDPQEYEVRPIRGGGLVQGANNFVLDLESKVQIDEIIGNRKLTPDEVATMFIAWVVAWEGVSNSVVLAKDMMLIGTGLGQQDRRGATKLAISRARDAGHIITGAFFASDGFFPFAVAKKDDLLEAIQLLVGAGCFGGIVPADGKRWNEVRDFMESMMLFVIALNKAFRGFAKH